MKKTTWALSQISKSCDGDLLISIFAKGIWSIEIESTFEYFLHTINIRVETGDFDALLDKLIRHIEESISKVSNNIEEIIEKVTKFFLIKSNIRDLKIEVEIWIISKQIKVSWEVEITEISPIWIIENLIS